MLYFLRADFLAFISSSHLEVNLLFHPLIETAEVVMEDAFLLASSILKLPPPLDLWGMIYTQREFYFFCFSLPLFIASLLPLVF